MLSYENCLYNLKLIAKNTAEFEWSKYIDDGRSLTIDTQAKCLAIEILDNNPDLHDYLWHSLCRELNCKIPPSHIYKLSAYAIDPRKKHHYSSNIINQLR